MQRKIWFRRTRVLEGVDDFLQTTAAARTGALQGVLRAAHASFRAANRAPPPALGGISLPPEPPPKPRATAPPVPLPIRPRVVQALAADDSIAIDSCDSHQEIDCDADSVASFEALDEGGTHRCGYLGLGLVFVCSYVCHSRMQYHPKFGPGYRIFLSRSPFWYFFLFNWACYLAFCNGSLHEMSSCSILFYD